MTLLDIGATQADKIKGLAKLELHSLQDKEYARRIETYILPCLSSNFPSANMVKILWQHLHNLNLADPYFDKSGTINMILGTEVYGQLLG